MYARASVETRLSDFLSVQVKISSCSMPRNRKATGCKQGRPSHNCGTHRQGEATPIVPGWMQDVASVYNEQLHMTLQSMRDYYGTWWTGTNDQTGQAWNGPLTGYSQASTWPCVTTAVAWNEAASRRSQSSTWSWTPVAVNQVAYPQQQPSAVNWAQQLPPIPKWIHRKDQRFHEKKNNEKKIRCDACGKWKKGILGGSFKISPHAQGLVVRDRERAWRAGTWNATWFCTYCMDNLCGPETMRGHEQRLEERQRYLQWRRSRGNG